MAPSQQEYHHQKEEEYHQYTHKKFNCGYSHKKLGMRLMRRNSQEELQQQEACNSQKNNTLFRPYALGNESSKDIKSPNTQQNPAATIQEQQSQFYTSPIPYQLYQTPQQSQEEYAQKLQRQRAALYMKHVMQFYENGNGWPSVHPNALNNPGLYQQF